MKKYLQNHAKTVTAQSEVVKRTLNERLQITANNDADATGFITAREHNNLLMKMKDRKRKIASSETINEPATKKNIQNQVDKNIKEEKHPAQERCLTGDVAQIQKFLKEFPNFKHFYEVFGKVHKVDSRADHKILLLKNSSGPGPILQAIYYEIDFKMVQVKKGDTVRCVGKFINSNSRLTLFKIEIIDETRYRLLVQRLYALSNFKIRQIN